MGGLRNYGRLPVSTTPDTRHIIITVHKIWIYYQEILLTAGKSCSKCRVQICSDVMEKKNDNFSHETCSDLTYECAIGALQQEGEREEEETLMENNSF